MQANSHSDNASQNPISRLWKYLRQTHPNITDIEMRRQSRLLAGLLLTLFFGVFVASLILGRNSFTDGIPQQTMILWVGMLLLSVIYFINRHGKYRLGAGLFVALNFLMVHFIPIATYDFSWLFFTTMFIVLTATLMPRNVTLALFASSFVIQILIRIFIPSPIVMSNLSTIIIFGITSSMVLVFVQHRAGLEEERRQELQTVNAALRESEFVLEKRVAERTSELEIAKLETENALQKAIEADKIKSQFLSAMSHELRTPLNSILSFSELMSMGTFGDVNDEQVEFLNKILFSGRHLLSLINDVLDISKIESGMMKLFVEEGFDVSKEIKQAQATVEKLIGDKDVQLLVDTDTDFPALTVDKRRLRQVLFNLLSNAVKFTEAGTITLAAKKKADHVLFAIFDTGPGIAENQHASIFEPFVQTETGIKHAGGTGLGLPISKRLVEAHGGRLWVESAVGEGAAFYFTIPLSPIVKTGEVPVLVEA